jgi:hypothetical protein
MANNRFTRILIEGQEVWKAIPGYAGYEASNFGNIRSYRSVSRKSPIRQTPKLLKLRNGKNNRPIITLRIDKGIWKTIQVDRAVTLCFLGAKPDHKEICHNDGNPWNNHVDNLRYDTHINNMADKVDHGTNNDGENHGLAKLTEVQIQEIRSRYRAGEFQRQLATEFDITQTCVSRIILGKSWSRTEGRTFTKTESTQRRKQNATGENNPSVTLNTVQVLEIRQRAENNESKAKLAREFKVSKSTISRITLNRGWKHV